jgi:hypothetical protein
MKFLKGLLGGVALLLFANTVTAHAQVEFAGIGSSAQFLQLGEAAALETEGTIYPEACVWTQASGLSTTAFALDPTTSNTAKDSGQVWVTWTKGSTGTCTAPAGTGIFVSFYLQTDSVVGDRCLFNACHVEFPAALTATSNLLSSVNSSISEVALPTAIFNLLMPTSAGTTVNAAGTDIRPEDAEFAIKRATTSCGSSVATGTYGSVSSTQYLGLGYNSTFTSGNSNSVITGFTGSTFNVVPFSLPSSFTVTPLGATPILVVVNSTDGSSTGFDDSNITNLNRSTLALYLDGSIGNTQDALIPGDTETGKPTTVILREPLSGTYNTMEYNIPNTLGLQTSQDVGFNQLPFSSSTAFNRNCNGPVGTGVEPEWNANGTAMTALASGANRIRAIGTGQELSFALTPPSGANTDVLAYAFWSTSNFAGFTSSAAPHAKYLSIDGVDPLFANYNGTIPTTSTALHTVTFTHVADGTYPIWSLLRLVTTASGATTAAQDLATGAQIFGAPGVTATHPDFIPFTSLHVERSHFTPPGVTYPGSTPKNSMCSTQAEQGGDVGGIPIPCKADSDYATDTGITAGFINRRW